MKVKVTGIVDGTVTVTGDKVVTGELTVVVVTVVAVAVTVDVAGVTVVWRKEEQSCLVFLVGNAVASTANTYATQLPSPKHQ